MSSLLEIVAEWNPKLLSSGQIRMECPFRENHSDGSGMQSFFMSPDINAYHCFAGETKVPTSKGTFEICDLAGKSVEVLTNGKYVLAHFKHYGKQQLWELHLSREGKSKVIRTTSKHRWFIRDSMREVTTDNLKVGQYLKHVDFDKILEDKQSKQGIRHGIVFGDGTTDRSRKTHKTLVNLHGVKMELSRYFSHKENKGVKVRESGDEYIRVYNVNKGSTYKTLPPLSSSLKYLRGFLAGYIATDGCISTKGVLVLNSKNIDELEFCRQAFFRLGVSTSSISRQLRKGYLDYETPVYKISVSTKNLDASFFIRSDQKERFLKHTKKYERNRWRIVRVTPTEVFEDVYCAEVPTYHSFALEDNILTGNCFSCSAKGTIIRLLTTRFGIGYFKAVEYVRLTDHEVKKGKFELDISWNREVPDSFLRRGFRKEVLEYFKLGTTKDGQTVIPFYEDFNNPETLKGYQLRTDGEKRFVRNSTNFDKKNYLYNLDTSYDYTILVEGYSDVFRLYQHGYNACATLGTSLSDEQAQKLYQFDKVYLARDNDLPGRIATEKDYNKLHKHVEVLLVPYQQKDPGACISPKVWRNAFNKSTDYFTYSYYMTMDWDGYLEMREKLKL